MVRWSPEVEDMHGLPRGSFRRTAGRLARQRCILTTASGRLATAQGAIRTQSDYEVEYRTIRPDGALLLDGGTRLDRVFTVTAKRCAWPGMCMDITTRKRTEEALRKTEKLAAAGGWLRPLRMKSTIHSRP